MAERLVSVGAVAERFGVSSNAVKLWEEAGLLPRADRLMPGSRRVWRESDIAAAEDRIRRRRAGVGEVEMPSAA